MSSRCHGICSRLPHEKVVRWLSDQMKKLFRYCSKCSLFIRHSLDTVYCKCCGCKLRTRVHRRRKNRTSTPRTRLWQRRHPEQHKKYNKLYYDNNRQRLLEKSRIYNLRTRLLKIFFITLYPHLLLINEDVRVRPTQIQTIST